MEARSASLDFTESTVIGDTQGSHEQMIQKDPPTGPSIWDLESNKGSETEGSPEKPPTRRHYLFKRDVGGKKTDSKPNKWHEDLIIPKVDDFFDGYPKLAAFMESDANFMEFRQYKYLRIRRLLHMQAELKEMEDQLSHLDAQDAEHDEINLKSRDRDDKQKWPRRKELLEDIHCKLDQYDDLLFRTYNLMKMKKPTSRNRGSYARYMTSKKMIANDEREFIRYSEDLVALGGELEDGPINGWVEDLLRLTSIRISQFFFRSKAQRRRTNDKYLNYYDKGRLDIFVKLIMTILGTILLMVPVFVLYKLQQTGYVKDIIVLAFTLAFAIFVSVFTKAKRHEIFAATAAYCAVLIVFLSNSSYLIVVNNTNGGTLQNLTTNNSGWTTNLLNAISQ